jgi:phosphoserine aminotransferase
MLSATKQPSSAPGKDGTMRGKSVKEITDDRTFMSERVLNFSAGPAVLPEPVLAEAQRDLLALPGVGASILEISHRSPTFEKIIAQAEANLRKLLGIGDNYAVLFLQGGARLQFSMIPMNLMGGGRRLCNYLVTGSWSKYAAQEAVKFGEAKVIWDGKSTNYDRLPANSDLSVDQKSAFLYYASNETIQGVQFQDEPNAGEVPLVCDSSSDFLSRPIDINKYGLYYACAQKNAGPAGLTVVVIRKDLLPRSSESLPGYLNFHTHAEAQSLWNTAPTFGIYILMLVTKWLIDQVGGLEKMETLNRSKSKLLYDVIDTSDGFYIGHSQPAWRSMMNVSFRLPSEELTKKFVDGAEKRRMTDLKGHRSVGGIRASLYNAMPVEGVKTLRDYMVEFRKENAK